MQPYISIFSNVNWPHESALVLQDSILSILRDQSECSVVLTGGKTAARLYKAWALVLKREKMTGVNFYFGDERCVLFDDIHSNFNMVMSTLFSAGLPSGCSINPIQVDDKDSEQAALSYEKKLPKKVDILILTAGEDGHIASLFPGSDALKEFHRRVTHIKGPCEPINRITITPEVVKNAKKIFLLATGSVKGLALHNALHSSLDVHLNPVLLARPGVWLLDQDAANML